jgi:hypothetical protein
VANVPLTWPAGTFARRPVCTKLWLANRKTRNSPGRPVGVTMGMCTSFHLLVGRTAAVPWLPLNFIGCYYYYGHQVVQLWML